MRLGRCLSSEILIIHNLIFNFGGEAGKNKVKTMQITQCMLDTSCTYAG